MRDESWRELFRASGLKPGVTAALCFICLCSAPCLGEPQQAEGPFEKNQVLMERGEYKAAMLGFMDMVVADPGDARAREYLKLSGERVVKGERMAALAEKKQLLTEALNSRQLILTLRAVKEKRAAPWKKNMARAVSLAGNIDTVKEAVAVFEQWLETTPVYSDNKKDFLDGLARMKEVFYKTIKSKYPYLVQGRTSVDSRDLAALTFSQESLNENAEHYVETGQAQKVLDKSDRLRRLEKEILQHYGVVEKGMELFSRMHYAESMTYFKEVVAFDAFNEEALFFMDQSQKRLGLERAGEELK